MEFPDPEYVKTEDGAYIAYLVVGDGPVDIAWQSDFGGNLDVGWELGWDRAWLEGTGGGRASDPARLAGMRLVEQERCAAEPRDEGSRPPDSS